MGFADRRFTLTLFTSIATLCAFSTTASAQWPQWGGPDRDFVVKEAPPLNVEWPENGPKKLWSVEVGDGYSTTIVDGGVLFTHYRKAEHEYVVALDAATGGRKWEQKYEAPLFEGIYAQFGDGPQATPLIVGNRLFAVGIAGVIHCLSKDDGKVLWKRDLMAEHGCKPNACGYAASPYPYKDTLILPGGASGFGMMALKQSSGEVAWHKHDYPLGYSSPILIDVDGQAQIAMFTGEEISGFNPDSGELAWTFPHKTNYNVNAMTPVWGAGNVLVLSSAYGAGARGLQLTREGDKTTVKELWSDNKIQVHYSNGVRIGDVVYMSSGDFGPAFLTAVNAKSGEVLWKERGFAKASMISAGGRLIILDEDGKLAIATPTAKGLEVHCQASMFDTICRTSPTLVGTTLYVRAGSALHAIDLG